jgi:hypothetical protein
MLPVICKISKEISIYGYVSMLVNIFKEQKTKIGILCSSRTYEGVPISFRTGAAICTAVVVECCNGR